MRCQRGATINMEAKVDGSGHSVELVNGGVQEKHPPILAPKLTTNQNARFLPLADRHLLPSAQGQLAHLLQIILLITFAPLTIKVLTTLSSRPLAKPNLPFTPDHRP